MNLGNRGIFLTTRQTVLKVDNLDRAAIETNVIQLNPHKLNVDDSDDEFQIKLILYNAAHQYDRAHKHGFLLANSSEMLLYLDLHLEKGLPEYCESSSLRNRQKTESELK